MSNTFTKGQGNFGKIHAKVMKVLLGAALKGDQPVVANLSDQTSVASLLVQNTEYVLNTLSLPANAFSRTGSSMVITGWGVLAGNANAKTLKLYLGTQVLATITGNTGNAVAFTLEAIVTRTGSKTQSYHSWLSINGTYTEADGTATQDDTTALVIKTASINTAAAAASATGNGLVVQFNT